MVRLENVLFPPPVANISGKIFLGALFNTLKFPYKSVPPHTFDASYAHEKKSWLGLKN
jgi:hypothetical protein